MSDSSSNNQNQIDILEAQLLESPDNHEVKEKLAGLLLEDRDLSKAQVLFQELYDVDDKNIIALWGLARIHYVSKEFQESYRLCVKLAKLTHNEINSHQCLLFCKTCVHTNRLGEAKHWFDLAIERDASILHNELDLVRLLRLDSFQVDAMEEAENNETHNFISIKLPHQVTGNNEEVRLLLPHITPQNYNGHVENIDIAEKTIEPITFNDVIGHHSIKRKLIRDIVLPLGHKELSRQLKKNNTNKVLMFGAPGVGKTSLCRGLFNESDLNYLNVELHSLIKLPHQELLVKLELLQQYIHQHAPVILILEGVEHLIPHENYQLSAQVRLSCKYITKFLFDDICSNLMLNQKVSIIGITNKPWLLSGEFIGSMGFNQVIYVPPPTNQEKVEILEALLQSKESEYLKIEDINIPQIVNVINRYYQSGADINVLVDNVLSEILLRNYVNSDDDSMSCVDTNLILDIARREFPNPAVYKWMEKARKHLEPKNSSLHYLWHCMR